jgi:aldehyde:ferredoxin oxidoreductase
VLSLSRQKRITYSFLEWSVGMESLIWRANISNGTVTSEPVPESWQRLGGRGLIARILLDEVPAGCDPLGPCAKLIWAPGLLVGHMISSCDRISVGGKSPLTGGVKESNAGGSTGLRLSHLGIKALILEGMPPDEHWRLLHLSATEGHFEIVDDMSGLGVYQTAERLLKRYGPKVGVAMIGPGGEMRLAAAGILNLDKDREPSRINGRGGLGAVMGSKQLKAIVIDSAGSEKPPLVDPERFRTAQKLYTQELMAQPQTAIYADYGTASLVHLCDGFGGLPTRNFSSGIFEGAEKISGEKLRELLLERGGESNPTHTCMAGCVTRSSNCFGGPDGKKIVAPIEYETIALMGSNLGIDDLDAIAQMNWQLNDLGLDTIEIGVALGLTTEVSMLNFGDVDRVMKLLEEIRQGTPLGRVLGNGAAITGRVFGIRRVPVVKGQAICAYDPRAIKGTGVTYATSPQGADHTAGLTIRAEVDHLDPTVQVALSRNGQINNAGYDTLGVCVFSSFGFAKAPSALRDLLTARYGWDVSDGILQELGRETLQLERAFNRAAGFVPSDDRIPEWMTTEPLPPHNSVFDVPDEELDGIFQW